MTALVPLVFLLAAGEGAYRLFWVLFGTSNQLLLRVGCYNRGTHCSVDTGGTISHILHGSDITQPFCLSLERHGFRDAGALRPESPEQLRSFERLRANDEREIRAEHDTENEDECESDDDHMSFRFTE